MDSASRLTQIINQLKFLEYKVNLIMENTPVISPDVKELNKTLKDKWEAYKNHQ